MNQTEHQVIEQLQSYKRIVARIKILEKYSVGNGITVSRLNEDDQLQELHSKLRGLPSYMYLSKHEQRLETAAHAYLGRYPAGTRGQLAEVKQTQGADAEDEKLLRELRRKIEKVIEARAGQVNDFEAIIAQISELQDLRKQKEEIDWALQVLEEYKPQYGKLLRLQFVELKEWPELAKEIGVSLATARRWGAKALLEYGIITGCRISEKKMRQI